MSKKTSTTKKECQEKKEVCVCQPKPSLGKTVAKVAIGMIILSAICKK